MFEDEASFWLDGTLHQTWARVGVQPRVDTFGMRKTAHVFGAVSVEARPRLHYLFAPVFNGQTFLAFLKLIVRRSRRKVFLVIDNGPCHHLDAEGTAWLATNRHRLALFRLPPYSPEFNPSKGCGSRRRSGRPTTPSFTPRTSATRPSPPRLSTFARAPPSSPLR